MAAGSVLLVAVSLALIPYCSSDFLTESKEEILRLRKGLTYQDKKSDILFLLDTSGSLSNAHFLEEKRFVTNLLNEIVVGFEATRVQVIPFGTSASSYIDFISQPAKSKNKCEFNEKFNRLTHQYGMTAMRLAFDEAWAVCFGSSSGDKRQPVSQFKTVVILLTDGYWNWPWDNSDPRPRAKQLRDGGVEILAIGVGGGISKSNLDSLVDNPATQSFHLSGFDRFAELATYIRGDPYEQLWQVSDVPSSKCSDTCDAKAVCACGLVYGDYKCACPKGYYGAGTTGQCTQCPINTYKDFQGYAGRCTSCPVNSGHDSIGSTQINDCKCFKGYKGNPERNEACVVRSCDLLLAPKNGKFKGGGTCAREYDTECEVECNEGYEISGSAKRKCEVGPTDTMQWSGSTTQCIEIKCAALSIPNANPPTGDCVFDSKPAVEMVYQTKCTYTCNRGYNLVGSKDRVCQLDESWSGSGTGCQKITCPALSKVGVGTYSPGECDDQVMDFDRICELRCPSGYHIFPGAQDEYTQTRKCLLTGQWDGEQKSCKDNQPPKLTCPTEAVKFDNDPGKNVASVTWSFDFSDNSLTVNEPGVTKEKFKVVLTIEGNETSTTLPKLLTIGKHAIHYNVTDPAGNSQICNFDVDVIDTEAPTCEYCPSNILLDNITTPNFRVNWAAPRCSDNSGIPPELKGNRFSGDQFGVPGKYEINYQVSDKASNEGNCTFTIDLKMLSCKMYAPPINGSLRCNFINNEPFCSIACRQGTDFVFDPPLNYYCSAGQWQFWGFGKFETRLPWPDCSVRDTPSFIKSQGLAGFYFEGDCNDPNVKEKIVDEYWNLLNGPYIPPPFCKFNSNCKKENIVVYCGATDKADKRRRRENTREVHIRFDYINKDTGLKQNVDDQASQIEFNQKKAEVQSSVIDDVAQKTKDPNVWNQFKVTSGLELKGSYELKDADAYCSEDGAVVKKCNEWDVNWSTGEYKCNKDDGSITKCVRCPAGTYYNKDNDDCQMCPEGTFSREEGILYKCNACPKGKWTFGDRKENFTSCKDECGPGFFSSTGIARCYKCPLEYYSDGQRNKVCSKCPSGTTTVLAASKGIEDCGMKCAPGTYSKNGVEPCIPCPVGTYQNGQGQLTCLPCEKQLSTYGTGADSVGLCTEINRCASSPCKNGATCINSKDSYRCICEAGYEGVNCEQEIDECLSDPCYQGATCLNKLNAYQCLCPEGFQGKTCDEQVSLCAKNKPCNNGGTCLDKAGGFECQCAKGYAGVFCELNSDECASNPCKNDAVCISGLDDFSCMCKPGFSGKMCQINTDDCAGEPCVNGGKCVDGVRTYTCNCPAGYSGARCEHLIDECQSSPCQNGGKCVDKLGDYECICKPSYTGNKCDQKLSRDYDLNLYSRVSKSYSLVMKPIPDLTAFTFTFWMRTSDKNPGTVLSYATNDGGKVQDNALTIQDYASLTLFVNNVTQFVKIDASDGQWHHVAVTWESASGTWYSYLDCKESGRYSEPFQQGQVIKGGGVLILGQEQDELGGGFNTEESFIGDISQANLFDYVLSANEICNLHLDCSNFQGNLLGWADFRENLEGNYVETPSSYACDFGSAFRRYAPYPGARMSSSRKTLSNKSPEECVTACNNEGGFVCRSFDYEKSASKCYLSDKSSADKEISVDSSNAFDYYELNCLNEVGVSSEVAIPNDRMTASSSYNSAHGPHGGRLHLHSVRNSQGTTTLTGAWCAKTNNNNQWLQIQLDAVMTISGVATQGREDAAQWVTSYKLQYSTDGSSWTYYSQTLSGNTDQNTVVKHHVRPFSAKYVRFRPQGYSSHVSMRVEIYACPLPLTKPVDSANECSPNPCSNGATCVNWYNMYLCRCPAGYTGKKCETAVSCEDPGTPIYGKKSSSNYGPGSTITFSCNSGYEVKGSSSRTCQNGEWTGTQPTCEDINECAGNHGCAQWCRNTIGNFNCACQKGYSLVGKSCNDINECASSNGGCSHSCHNTAGSFSCSCPVGLTKQAGGRSCVDVDECATNKGGCEHNCDNKMGTYECSCNKGYALRSDKKTCLKLSCPNLGNPQFGTIAYSSGLSLDSTATATCQAGYTTTGGAVRTCLADSTWSGVVATCVRVYCREVGTVKNALRTIQGYMSNQAVVGSTARFTCNANYIIEGSAERKCQNDGSWSGVQPRCIAAFCDKLATPSHGEVQGFRFELGATLRVNCEVGYDLVPESSSFRECEQKNGGGGQWSGQDPTCNLKDCGNPGVPYGGFSSFQSTTYLSVVMYACKEKHHLEGSATQVCQADGKWSGEKPVCLERSCGNPGVPQNGQKIGDSHKYGNTVTFKCNTGYTMIGSSSRTCQESDAKWTGTQPTCQIVDCGDPGLIGNGFRYGTKTTYLSIMYFDCNPGYKLSGSTGRYCQSSGSWSGSQPTCVATGCGANLIGPTGEIKSPNYPNNYGNNQHCTWQITVPVNKQVRLDFSEFKTESGKDILYVYDTGSREPTISFSGTTYKPPPFTTSGRSIRIRLVTDGGNTLKGFKLAYKQVAAGCGGVRIGGPGTLVSPGFPNGYAHNLDCVWLLHIPGEKVDLRFVEMKTESTYDYVSIHKGYYVSSDHLIAAGLSGHDVPGGSFVGTDYMWVRFRTNYINSDSAFHSGWKADYKRYYPYFDVTKKK